MTFSIPEYKDKTVFAVAGSPTETLLKLAKEHKAPVHHDCRDGECGDCVVCVSSVDTKERMGGPLTEKEELVLRQLGKLTEELDQMAVDDLPSE